MRGAFARGTITDKILGSGVSVGLKGVSEGVGTEIGVVVFPVEGVAAVVSVVDPAGKQLAKNTNPITVKTIDLLRVMIIVLRKTVSPRYGLVK